MMIRNLATKTRNSESVAIASYQRFRSSHFHSCRIGRPSLLLTHRTGFLESSSVQSAESVECISPYIVMNIRRLRTFNPYDTTPWNEVPYYEKNQTDFIDGPMMPREKEKKKKKKKKKPEKVIPPMDSIEQALEKMRIRFDEIEKEHLGPTRGIRTVKWIAGKKCEGIHKTVTTKMANSILNSWIYCRHALLHGHYQLNDMTKKELAESILGKGTKTKVPDREARLILKELFRFGKSNQFDRYMKEHLAKMKMMGRAAVASERNRLGIPKIRNIATVEEMAQHGYTQQEIDDELLSRVKKDENRKLKKYRKEMPAYLRHEISGSRRQEARKIERILRKKEKKRLLLQQEEEARYGPALSESSSKAPVRGEDDTDSEDDDSDYDSDDDIEDEDDDDSDDHDDSYTSSDEDDDDDDDDDDGVDDLTVTDNGNINDSNNGSGISERGNENAVDKGNEENVSFKVLSDSTDSQHETSNIDDAGGVPSTVVPSTQH